MNIRFATHADQPAIIALIDEVLQEYDDSICLTGSESDLTDIEKNYFKQGGAFWVIESQPESESPPVILGTHAAKPIPTQPETCVFTRLYVASKLRGTEWTHRLMQTNIDWARQQSTNRIEFWSDVRFHRAHRFFAKFGFTTNGEVRTLHDSHLPYDETFFFLDL
jgi:putative acetyltransferase